MATSELEIRKQLEQTVTHLQSGRDLLTNGRYASAAAHAGEAAFHAGAALLLDERLEPSQHGDVITRVREMFVDRRRLTHEQGEKLNWVLGFRTAETSGMPVVAGEAQKALEFAESFLEATKVILEA